MTRFAEILSKKHKIPLIVLYPSNRFPMLHSFFTDFLIKFFAGNFKKDYAVGSEEYKI